MIRIKALAMAAICAASLSACSGTKASQENESTMETPQDTTNVKVAVETSAGNFTVMLYGDTPKHRDNFVKLVKEGYYNGTLFHRVINEFMVQAGDPDSRNAKPGQQLGMGGPEYKIDAEIIFPKHFHKRGALAAARQADQVNPLKQSSGSQFYIVTGQKLDSASVAQLDAMQQNNLRQSIFNRLVMAKRDSIQSMQRRGDHAGLKALQDTIIAQTETEAAKNTTPLVTDEMKNAYTTVGGTPHLDGQYTVFGEVVSGMDTIDRIEKTETDNADRPKNDIKIISMKIVE